MPLSEALWYVADGVTEVRPVDLPETPAGAVRVAARFSGISRGTERLVLKGRVPASEYQRMRCPHQDGEFPFPVKYGYALVGQIEDGPEARIGEHVFLLHPHQTRMCVPLSAVHALPTGLPPRRAALAANMETALNVCWDATVSPGDRILIVGGGVLGLLIAGIAGRLPGAEVTVTDIDPARQNIAGQLGVDFRSPAMTPDNYDIVIHTSGTAEGLRLALAAAGTEARVVEASWYGDKKISVPLGEAFHARRLQLISSQVGVVPPDRRARWTNARRMSKALELLCDARFDALITGEIAFAAAARELPKLLADNSAGLMTVLTYS